MVGCTLLLLDGSKCRESGASRAGRRAATTLANDTDRCWFGNYSRYPHCLLIDQAAKPMTQAQYDSAIDNIFTKYPTKALLERAVAQCKGGE
ncbi:MAG TPA: hypothetical protein V6C97_21120 [Oculatellaceae cyanobacterium]